MKTFNFTVNTNGRFDSPSAVSLNQYESGARFLFDLPAAWQEGVTVSLAYCRGSSFKRGTPTSPLEKTGDGKYIYTVSPAFTQTAGKMTMQLVSDTGLRSDLNRAVIVTPSIKGLSADTLNSGNAPEFLEHIMKRLDNLRAVDAFSKEETAAFLEAKADKAELALKADKTELTAKADKAELEAKADKNELAAKADKSDTFTKNEVRGLLEGIASDNDNGSVIEDIFEEIKGVNAALAKRGRQAATFVVGFSEDCDFRVTGETGHQSIIAAAMSALPADGGKIILREGTYAVSAAISVNKPNVTIEGMGPSTVLTYPAATSQAVISVAQSNCTIKNLKITECYRGIITVANTDIENPAIKGTTIDSVHFSNWTNSVIMISAAYDYTIMNCSFFGRNCISTGTYQSTRLRIQNNNFYKSRNTVSLSRGDSHVIITGNFFLERDDNSGISVDLSDSVNVVVSNNHFLGKYRCISLNAGTTGALVTGNLMVSCATGIIKAGTNNHYTGNKFDTTIID